MATTAMTYPMADDVLSALLELARQEKDGNRALIFRGHDEDLQKIFYELGQKYKSALLSTFVFSNSGPRPYSPILSDSVSKLQLAGLIGRQNPDYEFIFTTPATADYYQVVLSKRFTDAQKNELKEIAHGLLQLVQTV